MKFTFFIFLSAFFVSVQAQKKYSLKNFPQDKIMVVAHRGDWRDAPENSIWAIKKAIEKGADMAEIDLAITKDSILILMHDKTIDRTTSGKGKPSDYTLNEIKQLFLRDGSGVITEMKIPTLEEALQVSKGKILLNLDKAFDYFDLVFPLVKKYEMQDEVLYKGNVSYQKFDEKYGKIKSEIHFMPVIRLEKGQGWEFIQPYLDNYTPYGFEFTIGNTEEFMIDFSKLRQKGFRIWVNSLWASHCAGHHDDKALENPDIYDWFVKNNVNIIQTDRISELVSFLQKRNLAVSASKSKKSKYRGKK